MNDPGSTRVPNATKFQGHGSVSLEKILRVFYRIGRGGHTGHFGLDSLNILSSLPT